MAYREVAPEPYEARNYFKFNAIGDKLAGYFVSQTPAQGSFGGTDYNFQDRAGELQTVTAKGALLGQLKKADLKPGNKVIIEFHSTVNTGKESPMKVFKLLVDDAIHPIPARKAPAPKPSAPPEADPF